jgi:hypothetical protein
MKLKNPIKRKVLAKVRPKPFESVYKESAKEARWIALYEAVNMIFDKAEDLKMDPDNVEVHPLKIKEYMEATTDIYQRQILKNDYGIDLIYSENLD